MDNDQHEPQSEPIIIVDTWKEIRCSNPNYKGKPCRQLLMKGEVKSIEIKCHNCKRLYRIETIS